MAHVIYNKRNWRIVTLPGGNTACYDTDRIARGQFTKLKNRGVCTDELHAVEEYNAYVDKIPMVKTRNILNPDKEIDIRADQLGTINDPGTEAYHQF